MTTSTKSTKRGKLIVKEALTRGSVTASTYWYYIRNMGFWAFMMLFGRFALEIVYVRRNFWLSDWSEAGIDPNRTVSISKLTRL